MKKLVCMAIALALLGCVGCSGEVNPDELSRSETSTAAASILAATATVPGSTTETTTSETPTTMEEPSTTSTTIAASRASKSLIDYPIEKITVLKRYASNANPGEIIKEFSTDEQKSFLACMESEFWKQTEIGRWIRTNPTINGGSFIFFVEGAGGQVSVIHLYGARAAAMIHFGVSSLTPDQYYYAINQPPMSLSTKDFTYYFVENETHDALSALCEQ